MTAGGSGARRLLQRAAHVLEEGPVHTLDLARRVLGLEGNPGAASAAVFTLLGSDVRFHVDGDGRWSLARAGTKVGPALQAERYAVVDVETTGGAPSRGHRVTEVAVVEVREGVVEETYHTLINPGRSIPPRISRITGITDEMVAAAPYFDQVADEVLDRLRGRTFVAHNARFDWGFVRTELADAIGETPAGRPLCTIKLVRRLVPILRRRNLDAVTAHYGVTVEGRHRALGDAVATARILLRLLDEAGRRGIGDLAALRRFLAGDAGAEA